MRYFLNNVDIRYFEYMAIFGGVTSKIEYHENESPGCEFRLFLNGGQKYNTYLSHAFSRKNLPYWLMCRKIRIFAILEKLYG